MAAGTATHDFVGPDRQAAEALVVALSEYGFPQVSARPRTPSQKEIRGMSWQVVVDEGSYSYDIVGRRQLARTELGARALARGSGGFRIGGSTVSSVRAPSLRRSNPPILVVNPGSRAPYVEFHTSTAPPVGHLSLEPDQRVEQSPSLDFLATVNWAGLDHAYGSAQDLPDLITRLVTTRDKERWDEISFELTNRVLHQGSCYSATAPALHALLSLVIDDAFRATKRYVVFMDALFAAGRYQETLLASRDRAAAYGEQPRSIPWSAEAHAEVGSLVPRLLGRWDIEPATNQLMLAALAAAYPQAGTAIEQKIAENTRDTTGTQVSWYLRLASQLIRGGPEALDTAMQNATWNGELSFGVLDDETIDPGTRALRVLCDAVAAYTERVRPRSLDAR